MSKQKSKTDIADFDCFYIVLEVCFGNMILIVSFYDTWFAHRLHFDTFVLLYMTFTIEI